MNEHDECVRELAELMLTSEPINIDINNCRVRILQAEAIMREQQPYVVPTHHQRRAAFPQIAADLKREKRPKFSLAPKKGPSVGRNESCPCGSGKKYKRCCRA